MLPLLIVPVVLGAGYVAYKKGYFGHKPGGPTAPVSSVNASAAIQKQITALQTQLAATQAAAHAAQLTNNAPMVSLHTANAAGLQIQIQQLQNQLAHAASL